MVLKTGRAYLKLVRREPDEQLYVLVVRNESVAGPGPLAEVLRSARERLGDVRLDVWDADRMRFTRTVTTTTTAEG